jgi:hypothetical protein
MTLKEKRQHVGNLYLGPRWQRRVERMSDDQITAIYMSHTQDGQMPSETESQPDIPSNGIGPHANEDDYPIC